MLTSSMYNIFWAGIYVLVVNSLRQLGSLVPVVTLLTSDLPLSVSSSQCLFITVRWSRNFSAVFGCFPTVFQLFSDDVFWLLKSSSSWTKLSMVGPQLFSGWYQMILDVFQCSQLFFDVFRLFSDDVFGQLKSSSSWTKLSYIMGPQLFSGWYQMILDVFRCSD